MKRKSVRHKGIHSIKASTQQFRNEAARAHTILTEIRKNHNFIENEELLFYTFEDGDYVVRGYLSKEGNLSFVETLLKDFPIYPLELGKGIRADGSIESLCELYTKAHLCLLPTHYSLSTEDQRVLFVYEHLERFITEYRAHTRGNLMTRFWQFLKWN